MGAAEEHVAGAPEHANPFRLFVTELADERLFPTPASPATSTRRRDHRPPLKRLLQVFAGLLTFE